MATQLDGAGPARRQLSDRLSGRPGLATHGWVIGLAALVCAYVGLALWHLRSIIDTASWNADNANMLNMSRELGGLGPGEVVNMGNAPNSTTLWVNSALYRLGGGGLVEVMPIVWYLLAAAAVVWSVWLACGRRPAIVTAVLLTCLNPVAMGLVTSHAVHGPTWFTVCILGAYAVHVASDRSSTSARSLAVALVVGLIAGANVASDPLAAPTAVVPLLGALAGVWYVARERRATIQTHAAVAFGAIVVAGLIARGIGPSTGIGSDLPPGTLATTNQMWSSFLQSIENAGRFFGPAPFGGSLSAFAGLKLLVGIAGIAGVVLAVRHGWRTLRAADSTPGSVAIDAPQRALALYWAGTVAIGGAVVLTSPLAFEVRESSVRYEFNLFLAAAVALPVWLFGKGPTGARFAVALGAVAAVVGIGGLLNTRDDRRAFLSSAMVVDGPRAMEYARSKGATRGYSGYWNASGLSWKTGHRLLPVANCDSPDGRTLCMSPFAVPPHLMKPVPGAKSFILVDHAYPGAPEDRYLTRFGPWEEQLPIGGVFIAIYPYDIATRFGSPTYGDVPPG